MRAFHFSDQELDAIHHDRYHHPHPRVQLKMEVLWLKAHGFAHARIAQLTRLGRRTVQRYLDDYLDGGLHAARRVGWHGNPSALEGHVAALEDHFLRHPPRSAAEAQAAIERRTGVRRSLSQVRAFLKRHSACPGGR